MIITDIKQIDRIAEEAFGNTTDVISVDMNDYAHIKEYSESLKAIMLEAPLLTENLVPSLDEAICEAGSEDINNVLLYIKCNAAGVFSLTIEQVNLLIEALNNHIGVANIVWGVGEGDKNDENVSIIILLGYGNRE